MGFVAYWDSKPIDAIHSDSPVVYTSDKNLNLYTIDKIHLNCDVVDGSVVNGKREPIIFKFFHKNQTVIMYFASLKQFIKKTDKSVLNTTNFI